MAIPDYQTVMLPLLKLVASAGKLSLRDAVKRICGEFNLTDAEAAQVLPSGNQRIIDNRVGWARTYLKKAGLLSYPQRGMVEITDRGRKVLADKPITINVKFLKQYPEFVEFQAPQSEDQSDLNSNVQSPEAPGTPEEILEASFLTLKRQLLNDVLDKIKSCSPAFFETLVVDVLVKMGYGGSRKDAGQAIGQSGDEGIDGIINEDRLGLDVIYIQAKRWEGNVSRPEIQKFAGALQGKRAKKGVFITTSDFTSEAREFAKGIDSKIVLISGKQLVELLWEHNVGLSASATYEVKKLDLDYFSDV